MSLGVSRRHDDAELVHSSSHVEAKAFSKPLRLLTASLQLAAVMVDVRGRLVAVSSMWSTVFGEPPSGSDAFFIDAYPGLSALQPDLEASLRNDGSNTRPIAFETSDRPMHYEFRVGPWTYDDGQLGGALILGLDVTELSTQNERLREANDRFDLVLAGTSVGIWDWIEVKNDTEYWSPKFYELLGYGQDEIEPSLPNFADLLHPDDLERTFAQVDDHLENGTPFDLEYRLRTKAGDYRWFRGTGKAARDAAGQPVRMAGSIEDIDSRIRSQQAIQRVNEDLEHFAHVASHDLREPARRQRLLIDLALEDHADDISPALRRDLETIKNQSIEMLNMITGFRALTSISGPDLTLEDLDLQAQATTAVADILSEDRARSATIDLPVRVKGYRQLVDMMLRNLILNANAHGTDPLRLELRSRVEGSATVIIVENNWDGNPDEVTNEYFKPFVAGRDRSGTGLGLSICRRVAEHHRGWIRMEPEPGIFRVEINLGAS